MDHLLKNSSCNVGPLIDFYLPTW